MRCRFPECRNQVFNRNEQQKKKEKHATIRVAAETHILHSYVNTLRGLAASRPGHTLQITIMASAAQMSARQNFRCTQYSICAKRVVDQTCQPGLSQRNTALTLSKKVTMVVVHTAITGVIVKIQGAWGPQK